MCHETPFHLDFVVVGVSPRHNKILISYCRKWCDLDENPRII